MQLFEPPDLTQIKVIEYCRKSTDTEDNQVFSLEDQHTFNQKAASAHNLNVDSKTLYESKTARKRGRPMFNQMVADIEAGKYQGILTWQANRLSRNAVDSGMLIELMDEGHLKAIITPTKVYLNSPEDKLMLHIEFGMAKKYVDDLSPSVKRGQYQKFQRGWYPGGQCKTGYRNERIFGEVIQVVDEERFPMLRKAVDLFLTGDSSVDRTLDYLNNRLKFRSRKTRMKGGKKMVKSHFYTFLKDPFNYGRLVWDGEETIVNPQLPRLMTEQEYWKIQALLGRKGVPRPKTHVDLGYRGIAKCGECGCSMVPYVKVKQLADSTFRNYYYMSCSRSKPGYKCTQPQINFQQFEEQALFVLDSISISDDYSKWAIKWIRKTHETETSQQKNTLEALQSEKASLQDRLNNLLTLRIDKEIDEEEYRAVKETLKARQAEIDSNISSLDYRTDEWIDRAERVFDFANNAKSWFEHGDFERKTTILRGLGSNFFVKDIKVTIDLQNPYVIFKRNAQLLSRPFSTPELKDLSEEKPKTVFADAIWAV